MAGRLGSNRKTEQIIEDGRVEACFGGLRFRTLGKTHTGFGLRERQSKSI